MSCSSFLPPVLPLKIPQINSLDALLIPSSATCQAPKINSFHPPSSLSATPRAPPIALIPCHPFPPPFLHHKSVALMSCHPVPPPFLHHKSWVLVSVCSSRCLAGSGSLNIYMCDSIYDVPVYMVFVYICL